MPIPQTPSGGYGLPLTVQTPPADSVAAIFINAGAPFALAGDGTIYPLGGGGGTPTQIVNDGGDVSISATGQISGTSPAGQDITFAAGGNATFVHAATGANLQLTAAAATLSGAFGLGVVQINAAGNILLNNTGPATLTLDPTGAISLNNLFGTFQIDATGNITLLGPAGTQVRLLSSGSVQLVTAAMSLELSSTGEIILNGNPGVAGERITSGGPGAAVSWAP